jgi:O-acetyl-ADP-ribose deacetylase (regulator of RNase III)
MKTTITNLLHGCNDLEFESVALPAISTGIFCFPKDLAARCIFESAKEFYE